MTSAEKSDKAASSNYYFSDIILHLDGTIDEGNLDENVQIYHSNIVLLLTGVVREELEQATDDRNILSSNLVRELGQVTKTELTSDESGYDSEDDQRLEKRRKSRLRCRTPKHEDQVVQKKPEPTNRCFNRPPSGYKKNERKPKYRCYPTKSIVSFYLPKKSYPH